MINYCEIDKWASKSYSLIHNVSEEFNLGDITKVNENELNDFDLMTWGFPCTDISIAGKQKGFKDNDGNVTRSGLYYEGYRILKTKKPKYSIIENVKNLLSKKFSREYEQIINDLTEIGYNSYVQVLSATDFGIPQTRERVFIVSIRKDLDNGLFKFPNGYELTECAGDFIGNDYRELTTEQLESIHKSNFVQRKIYDGSKLAPTLLARDYKDGGKYFEHNGKFVRSNAIVHMRLMGFEDKDYHILKENNISETQIYKMAGNSIVVTKLEGIFKNLLKIT